MNYFCKRGKIICGVGCVVDDVLVFGVFFCIDIINKYGCVSWGGRDDDFFCIFFYMRFCFVKSSKVFCRVDNVFSIIFGLGNVGWIMFVIYGYCFFIDY